MTRSHSLILLIFNLIKAYESMLIRNDCRCAVCRARKSRCIALHDGACQRCVEKGEECDLESSQASQSPAVSSTANIHDQQMSISSPVSFHKEREAETPTSLQTSQVRVLGCSVESTKPDCRVQTSREHSPAPSEESEGAILIVEDLGRTRKFSFRLDP